MSNSYKIRIRVSNGKDRETFIPVSVVEKDKGRNVIVDILSSSKFHQLEEIEDVNEVWVKGRPKGTIRTREFVGKKWFLQPTTRKLGSIFDSYQVDMRMGVGESVKRVKENVDLFDQIERYLDRGVIPSFTLRYKRKHVLIAMEKKIDGRILVENYDPSGRVSGYSREYGGKFLDQDEIIELSQSGSDVSELSSEDYSSDGGYSDQTDVGGRRSPYGRGDMMVKQT